MHIASQLRATVTQYSISQCYGTDRYFPSPLLIPTTSQKLFLRHRPKQKTEPDYNKKTHRTSAYRKGSLYSCLHHCMKSGTKRRKAAEYYDFNYLKELRILGHIKFTTPLITFSKFQNLIVFFWTSTFHYTED